MGRLGVGGWGDEICRGLRTGVGESVTCPGLHTIVDLEYTADVGQSL